MIPGYDTSYLAAKRRVDELHQQADQDRLIREYRRLHPRTPIRLVAARRLRAVADRLAPPEPARPVDRRARLHHSGATP